MSEVEHTLEAADIADSMALVGVHPRPVSQETLLAALLTQNGHYVADKVVELMQVAGVAPETGMVMVVPSSHPAVAIPGEFTRRVLGEHAAFFFHGGRAAGMDEPRQEKQKRPWKTYVPPEDLLAAATVGCARWRMPDEPSIADRYAPPEEQKLRAQSRKVWSYFPWGSATRLGRDPLWDSDEIWPSAAHHHVWLHSYGYNSGAIAIAAGMFERAGCVPLGIVEVRWMFDLEDSDE